MDVIAVEEVDTPQGARDLVAGPFPEDGETRVCDTKSLHSSDANKHLGQCPGRSPTLRALLVTAGSEAREKKPKESLLTGRPGQGKIGRVNESELSTRLRNSRSRSSE